MAKTRSRSASARRESIEEERFEEGREEEDQGEKEGCVRGTNASHEDGLVSRASVPFQDADSGGEGARDAQRSGRTRSKRKKGEIEVVDKGYDDLTEDRKKVVLSFTHLLEKARDENPGLMKMDPEQVGMEVERSMFLTYGSVNREYRAKYRSLSFNLKSETNPELRRRVLAKDIPAAELVRYGPQELASHEEKEKRRAIAAEKEKLVVIEKGVEAPRIRKTHKGEEAVEPETEDPVLDDVQVAHLDRAGTPSESASLATGEGEMVSPEHDHKAITSTEEEGSKPTSEEKEGSKPTSEEKERMFYTLDETESQKPSTDMPADDEKESPASNGSVPSMVLEEIEISAADQVRLDAVNFDRGRLGGVLWKGTMSYTGHPTCEAEAYLRAKEDVLDELKGFLDLPESLLIKRLIMAKEADKYFRELSKSRSRAVFYAVLFPVDWKAEGCSSLTPVQKTKQLDFIMLSDELASDGRVGFAAGPNRVELYFLPPSGLSNKILQARGGSNLLPGSMLLAVVHPKFTSAISRDQGMGTSASDAERPIADARISQDLLNLAGPFGAKALEELLKQSSEKVTKMVGEGYQDHSARSGDPYHANASYGGTVPYGTAGAYLDTHAAGLPYGSAGEVGYRDWQYGPGSHVGGGAGYDWASNPMFPPPPPLPYPPPPGPHGGANLGDYYHG